MVIILALSKFKKSAVAVNIRMTCVWSENSAMIIAPVITQQHSLWEETKKCLYRVYSVYSISIAFLDDWYSLAVVIMILLCNENLRTYSPSHHGKTEPSDIPHELKPGEHQG